MTRKEQNKMLDNKIESNVNQYKVDRLNAEISAFSSGDLNKYEFLTRKDLKYKPNALDKARFEFSPLGQTFSTGLDKTAQGYQEEGVIKLLKDIRDGLAGGNRPNGNVDNRPDRPDDRPDRPDDRPDDRPNDRPDRPDDRPDRPDDRPDRPDDRLDRPDESDEDDEHDNNDDMPDSKTEERIAKISDDDKVFNILNKFRNNIESEMSNLDKMVTSKENKWSTNLNKLNNNVKKLDNYIKENNDKKINIEKKLLMN